jgi:hypothetical protein
VAGSAVAAVLQLMARQLPVKVGTYHHALLAHAVLRMLDLLLPSLNGGVFVHGSSRQPKAFESAAGQRESEAVPTHEAASCTTGIGAMDVAHSVLANVFAQLPSSVADFGLGLLCDAFPGTAAATMNPVASMPPQNVYNESKLPQPCSASPEICLDMRSSTAMSSLRQHLLEPGMRQGFLPMMQLELSALLQNNGRVRVPQDIRAWLHHKLHMPPLSELCAVESSSFIDMHETSWLTSLKNGYHEQYLQPEVRG